MEEKANAIIAYLKEAFPGIEVVRRESYNSSQKEIYEHHKDYFVILLDMSMHTLTVQRKKVVANRNLWQEGKSSMVCICVTSARK